MNKRTKIQNKLKKVNEDVLVNLLGKLPIKCQSCRFNSNCTEMESYMEYFVMNTCLNYTKAIELNEFIYMLKTRNINLQAVAVRYKLKMEFLNDILKGKMLMPYKYYVALCKRLFIEEFDEFYEYEKNFELE